jgi:hypothetical protein
MARINGSVSISAGLEQPVIARLCEPISNCLSRFKSSGIAAHAVVNIRPNTTTANTG